MHPLQKECDPNNPEQFAAWCWAAGIPDPSPSRPAPIPLISPPLVKGLSQMLWDFGFRHHPDLQVKWIQGSAGLGCIAGVSDSKPESGDDFQEAATDFLSANNPELLKMINSASDEDKRKLRESLEKNFEEIQELIKVLKEE